MVKKQNRKIVMLLTLLALVSIFYIGILIIARHCVSDMETGYTSVKICTNRWGDFPFGYRKGTPVRVTFTVRNISGAPLILTPREGGPAADIWFEMYAYHHPGQVDLKWSEDPKGQFISQLHLDPGQTYKIRWKVVPSDYFSDVPIRFSIVGLIPDATSGNLYGDRISGDYGGELR